MNSSTLARISTAQDSITSGSVIPGTMNRTVRLRAAGPTLSEFGVSDALAQPKLTLSRNSILVATQAGWTEASVSTDELSDAFDLVSAFRFATQANRDAALLASPAPRAYVVQLASADGGVGASLVEVYDVP